VHGPGADEPLVWYEGTNLRWLHSDRQGSIIGWSDINGAVTTYTYGPYGSRRIGRASGSADRPAASLILGVAGECEPRR